jgi:polyferredoxin
LRKLSQYLALLVFMIFFVMTRSGGERAELLALPIQLDPLAMLAHLLSSKLFLVSSSLALVTIILTVVFGRAWCGWLCPLGTVLDLFSLKRWHALTRSPSETWRGVKYGILTVVLVAALLGNLTLLVLDPLTLLFRTLTVSVWPLLDQVITSAETSLYRFSFLAGPISSFDTWVRPDILPTEPVGYRQTWIFAAVFLGVVALNAVAPRFWCRYLCPLGGLLGLFSKAALVQREVREDCKGCALCTDVCPTGTIDPAKGFASDPSECTMCMDCLEACPRSSVAFTSSLSMAAWNEYDPNRRKVLTSVGAGVAAVAMLGIDRLVGKQYPYLIQPPGGSLNDMLSKCIRCGMCMRACPTGAIQPAMLEAGLEGVWSPIIIPRMGYCDYACNACGQVCPVEAIPPLSVEDKRVQVIGKAIIDQDHCIAWAEKTDCIVCEEMCPLPEKAVELEPTEMFREDGTVVTVLLPEVLSERCTGCGICEYKCPVEGEAAIRVTAIEGEIVF